MLRISSPSPFLSIYSHTQLFASLSPNIHNNNKKKSNNNKNTNLAPAACLRIARMQMIEKLHKSTHKKESQYHTIYTSTCKIYYIYSQMYSENQKERENVRAKECVRQRHSTQLTHAHKSPDHFGTKSHAHRKTHTTRIDLLRVHSLYIQKETTRPHRHTQNTKHLCTATTQPKRTRTLRPSCLQRIRAIINPLPPSWHLYIDIYIYIYIYLSI